MYKDVLFKETLLKHMQATIRSKNHQITTNIQNKTSLSAYYDKKWVASCGLKCYSYGHACLESKDESESD